MHKLLILLLACSVMVLFSRCEPAGAATMDNDNVESSEGFTPDWTSLEKVEEDPEWFIDSKLGIYAHWGPYNVPDFGSEWYPRNMYIKGSKEFEYHKKNFGDQSEFSYHDFIPKFTAEKFDAEEWAQVMQDAGAKWGGPVAQHHDGFAMWDSKVNPWNALAMGPRQSGTPTGLNNSKK